MKRFVFILITMAFISLPNRYANAQDNTPPPNEQAPVTKEVATDDEYSPSKYQVPESIGGFEVLTVEEESNTFCMKSGIKRLTLRVPYADADEFLKSFDASAFLKEKEIAFGQSAKDFDVSFVGPTSNRDDLVKNMQEVQTKRKETLEKVGENCAEFAPPQGGGGPFADLSVVPVTNPPSTRRSWAIIQDGNAGVPSNNAQSVFLDAPNSIGNSQNSFSAWLNNVLTNGFYNGASPFLQAGLAFYPGSSAGYGVVVWTDSSVGLLPQTFSNLPFYAGHSYWFTITYTNGIWQICSYNYTIGTSTYQCQVRNGIPGWQIILNPWGSNIFFENGNTNANWYNGFSSAVTAWRARYHINGAWYWWSSRVRFVGTTCTGVVPANIYIGDILGGGYQYLNLSAIPRKC